MERSNLIPDSSFKKTHTGPNQSQDRRHVIALIFMCTQHCQAVHNVSIFEQLVEDFYSTEVIDDFLSRIRQPKTARQPSH